MLAYLDSLCAALLSRNAIEIFRLLGLPDAKKLPAKVREEAITIAKAGPESFIAPVQALHLYYKLSHLVNEDTELDEEVVSRPGRTSQPSRTYSPQMEIHFKTRKAG